MAFTEKAKNMTTFVRTEIQGALHSEENHLTVGVVRLGDPLEKAFVDVIEMHQRAAVSLTEAGWAKLAGESLQVSFEMSGQSDRETFIRGLAFAILANIGVPVGEVADTAKVEKMKATGRKMRKRLKSARDRIRFQDAEIAMLRKSDGERLQQVQSFQGTLAGLIDTVSVLRRQVEAEQKNAAGHRETSSILRDLLVAIATPRYAAFLAEQERVRE